jgi:hypothetical protein
MSTRMQQRRGTAAQWISTNSGNGPILAAGEIGYESDNNRFKIGDGVNHWVDLPYFANNEAITDLIDGAPELLNTLNELAAAMGDDPELITNTANTLDAHIDQTTSVHGIANTADLATQTFVNDTVADAIAGATVEQSALAGEGLSWNPDNEQFDVDTSIAREGTLQAHISETLNVHGIENTALLSTTEYVDDAVSTHQADTMDIHGIADTAELATKEFAASLLVGATKTNISITGDKTGLTIVAENGVSDSTTDELAEGTNNLYFSAERAQDAVGNAVGTGLEYNDATGAISVDATAVQSRVANVSDTEIGYLDGVTSSIQTQLDAKSTDLSSHNLETTSVHGIADTAALETQTGAQAKADAAATSAEGYTDSAIAALTKSSVGLANVDNTADADKPVSTATQTALNEKLDLAGGTMTGAITLHADPSSSHHAATKQYVDNTASGVIAKPQVLGATTANIDATYSNGTLGVGATLTHNTNGAFPSDAGGASGWAVGKGILVKNQTNKAENGRYFISDMGSASTPYVLTRCSYCDEASEIPGAYIFVQDGTLTGTGWIQTVADPATFVVGTDDINVFQFSGSGTITAGTNISVSGNEVSTVENPTFTSLTVGDVSNTEIGHLNGVTSAIQTQLDGKQAVVSGVSDTEIGYLDGVTSSIQTQINAKQAVVSGVSDTEIGYLDGVTSSIQSQLDSKVASLVSANSQTASYTLALSDKGKLVEMNIGSANTLTVPLNSSVAFPIGTQIDILQVGSGKTTVAGASGVTVNATPGLAVRAQWGSATLIKRAENTWVLIGDLTA